MAGSGLFRLYVGSLSRDVTEDDLKSLFDSHDLTEPLSIVVKPAGYAFIECPDQSTFDKAIEALNGLDFMGSVMTVEPSSISKRKRTNRIQICNVPNQATKDDIEQLVKTFGQVQRLDIVTTNSEVSVYVTYETQDQAQQAVDQLKDYDFQGSLLKSDYASLDNGNKSPANGRTRNSGNSRTAGYPLRILVPSDFVGAVIGKKGATIRRITTDCKARIDVHRENSAGLLEKVISIYGQPDNCSSACKQILEVMQNEAANTNRQEVPLKVLADDRYCGRIIGKEGKIIKKLREDTDSKISVSNVQELPALYPDRVIAIRGPPDNVSDAENAISTKLRECYEKEMHMPLPPGMLPGGMGARRSMRGESGGGLLGMYGGVQQGAYGGAMSSSSSQSGYYHQPGPSTSGGGGMYGGGGGVIGPPQQPTPSLHHHHQQQPSTSSTSPVVRDEILVMIPNTAVGAVIGAGGSHIKQIIRDSSAYVTIERKSDEESTAASDRTVTIKGSQEAKWKASYMIFEKLQKEGFAGSDDMRLRTAIYVPRSMIGRVIGKKGNNVRELQRLSGAMIKVLEDQQDQRSDDTIVEIYGNFMQTNMAQNRLRSFINQGLQSPLGAVSGAPLGGNGRLPRR